MDELIALNQSCDNGWAEREFSGVEFGDKRINRKDDKGNGGTVIKPISTD